MTFDGTPSKGCTTCRQRRIKCDQQRPVCGRCLKSQRQCLGYRDPKAVVFIDGLRARRTRKKNKHGADEEPSDGAEVASSDLLHIPRGILPRLEHQALAYFFTQFLSVPRRQDDYSFIFERLLQNYSSARGDSPIFDATAAAAIAVLSRKKGEPGLTPYYQARYHRAIASVQHAINDPKLSRSDQTLISIMMLGLFETMVADGDAMFNWGHHADGAYALAQHRGAEMLGSASSCELYWAACAQAVLTHLASGEPLAPFLDWESLWREELCLPKKNHFARLTALASRIPALRAAGMKWLRAPMSSQCALKIVNLMSSAKVVDRLLMAWSFEVPEKWKPRVVGVVEGGMSDIENSTVWPGDVETHFDLWTAQLWNQWRTLRMILHCIINCSLERLYAPSVLHELPVYQQSTKVLAELVDGLCASVPYSLYYPLPLLSGVESHTTWQEELSQNKDGASTNQTCQGSEAIASGAYSLLWPLFVAYGLVKLPSLQRRWIRGRLIFIGDSQGCGQAHVLGRFLRQRESDHEDRDEFETDYRAPPYEPCPELHSLLKSNKFWTIEGTAGQQKQTPEFKLFLRWRHDFLDKLAES